LEEGAYGAAYLAYKTGSMVVPATFTSTENKRIIGNILRLRKTSITVTIGKPFAIDTFADWRVTIETGTEKIMQVLASQLPVEYKGVYQNEPEAIHDRE
jgi:1-acyl-sn-glycerol-3-phosphate acyltransferase